MIRRPPRATLLPYTTLCRSALVAGLRPLLPPGTVRVARGLPAVVASRGLLAGAFFGMDALIPLLLTTVHGYSPTAAGLPLTAGAVGWALASQLQGRFPQVPRERLLRLGFVLLATGLAATVLAALPGTGGWPAYLTWAVAGLGMGFGMPSVGVLLLEQSPEHRRGADSAALQISDVTMSALCIGLAGVLVRSEEHTSELQSRQYLVCRLLLAKNPTTSRSSPSALLSLLTSSSPKPPHPLPFSWLHPPPTQSTHLGLPTAPYPLAWLGLRSAAP